MYYEERRKIHAAFESSPGETLEAIVRFVLATIQQRFHTVPAILDDWAQNGEKSATMWGSKRKGVKYIEKHSYEIASQLHGLDVVDTIDLLLTIPGLGIVKAAFVAQILGHDVGCIDVHNARLYDINVNAFRVTKKLTAKTRLAKIRSYVELCRALGGARFLWDSWCEYIADTQHLHFDDAEDVSEMHTLCIVKYVHPSRF